MLTAIGLWQLRYATHHDNWNADYWPGYSNPQPVAFVAPYNERDSWSLVTMANDDDPEAEEYVG